MTREKLREDVAEVLSFSHVDEEWEDLSEHSKVGYRNEATILLSYLHSQGIRLPDGSSLIEEKKC